MRRHNARASGCGGGDGDIGEGIVVVGDCVVGGSDVDDDDDGGNDGGGDGDVTMMEVVMTLIAMVIPVSVFH